MTTPIDCPQCQQPIPPDAPGGICPHCILDIGMQPRSPDVTAPLHSTGSTPFEAPSLSELARSFPALELLQFVGQGGMGAVYKARQIDLDRIVALKILPNRPDDDPNFSERFAREARALAKLTHPNIVMIFEFGQTDDYLYFLMEFVDGVNLRESLVDGRLKPEEALAIVPQICDALQFAHEEGIVHRDIKPENILIDRRGRVRIADFGLAKLVRTSTQGQALTGTRQVMGTLHYMAPEQMEKPTSVDHRADIYSLGVVFYELLTGELPLGRFDPPSEFAATGAQLDAVVMRTLEKEPDRRYQNISEVKTAMSTISNRVPPVRAFEPPKAGPASQNRMGKKMVVPFYIEDDWGTLKANGIMTCDGQQLTFELSKKDLLGRIVDGDIKSVAIGIDEIVSIECLSNYRERKIHILSSNIEVHRIIPAAKSARIVLKVAAVDAESADRFSIAVKQAMQGRNWSTAYEFAHDRSLSQLHPLAQVRFDENRVKRQLSGPASGFMLLAIVNILVAVGALLLAQVLIPPGDIGPFKFGTNGNMLSERSEYEELDEAIGSQAHLSLVGQNPTDEGEAEADAASSDAASTDSEKASTTIWIEQPQTQRVLFWVMVGLLLLSLPMGGCQLLAAFKLRRGESWTYCLVSSIMTLLPLHAAWLLGIPVGIWSLSTIGQLKVRAAFYRTLYEEDGLPPVEGNLYAAAPKKPGA